MKCPNCQFEQKPGAFCRSCGTTLPAEAPSDEFLENEMNPYAPPPLVEPVKPPYSAAPIRRDRVLATRAARLGARIIDSLLYCLAAVLGFLATAPFTDMLGEISEFGGLVTVLLFYIYQCVLVSRDGQTLAKRLFRIRIVMNRDGSPAGFVHAVLLRSWVNVLPQFMPFIGGLYPLIDALFIFGNDRRCILDLLAGTDVIDVVGTEARERELRYGDSKTPTFPDPDAF
ncbi:MAG: RDD family protein [Pirellulaceae bacterium]|nr:RDD family protein [Pirellulaceae bacterium]